MEIEFISNDEPDRRDAGYDCPCCHRLVKRYNRPFNSNMALALIALYNHREKGFIHVESLMTELGYKRCGDFSYLRHYRLIEAKSEERLDGSTRNGFYKITGTGMLFIEGKMKVQSKFLIYNNTFEGFDGPEISIIDALGKKFNFSELIHEATWDSYIN